MLALSQKATAYKKNRSKEHKEARKLVLLTKLFPLFFALFFGLVVWGIDTYIDTNKIIFPLLISAVAFSGVTSATKEWLRDKVRELREGCSLEPFF